MYLFLLSLVISNIYFIRSESCTQFETCGKCIGNNLSCVWCPDKTLKGPRCEPSRILKDIPTWCKTPINPNKSIKKLNSKTGQLTPQNIKIKVRPGDSFTFPMSYKPTQDYPIDIYYLMDNSYSMNFYKGKLVSQAQKIHDTLINKVKSNNVRFGCGSFVEKLALPFADPDKQRPNNFINHLPLTDNIKNFVDVVKKIKYTSNWDQPEAGLDGLMQAMVCEAIQWRNEARRMLILSTESTYHSAGDGKFVGAYKPNNMQCHLHNNHYNSTESLLYDYPSVSQINKVASEKGISIFFAVMKQVEREYTALADVIQGAKYAELKKDETGTNKDDLVDTIVEEYLLLVQNLVMDIGSVPPHIEVTLDPPCNKKNVKGCGVSHRKSVEVNVTVHVRRCPSDEHYINILELKPVGLREKIVLEVDVLCQCECEKEGHGKSYAEECSKSGVYQCGVCKCNENRYGKTCQCSGSSTEELDLGKCKAKNDTKLCSGRGYCSCGTCTKCWSGYYGDLCQYGEHECPTFEDKICGGNGTCSKNKCVCNSGWTGIDCTCPTTTEACVAANSLICSGNGECKCGACECTKVDTKNKRYTGKFCDSCDTCVEERCKQLGDYVECVYDGDKHICDGKFNVKSNRTVLKLNTTEIKDSQWWEANWCTQILADRSSIIYKYLDGNNSTLILIQKEKALPPETNIWIPIGSAIGAILLIGLLTIIGWKILVDIHDQREYKKFMEESKNAGFDVSENPLYEPPAVNFHNPTYSSN